jgi:CHAD domain-containing protein
MTGTPVEVELKYAIRDQQVVERLLDDDRLGDLAVGPWSTVEVVDRYIDTPDLRLETEGWNARLRTTEAGTSLDLKSLDDVAVEPDSSRRPQGGSLRRRIEWSGPATESLDPTDWPESAARARLAALVAEAPLEERFTLRQTRRERELRGTGGWAILSLDEVGVEHAGRPVGRFGALEVEMRGGDDRLLDVVAEMLEASGGVDDAPASKLEAALTLLARAGVDVPSAYTPALVEPTPAQADDEVPEPTDALDVSADPSEIAPSDELDRVQVAPDVAAPDDGVADLDAALERSDGAAREDAAVDRLLTAELTTMVAAHSDDDLPAFEAEAEEVALETPEGDATASEGPPARAKAGPRLTTGRAPGVTGGDPLAEAGRKILRFHFARMLDREAGTRSGEDVEDLHRMRVATRRMRAAWRLFGDAYRRKAERRYVRELRAVASSLGAVRDLDVLLENLAAYVAAHPAEEGEALQPLATAWQDQREAARRRMVVMLDSPAYRHFVDDYLDFVETESAAARPVDATEPSRVRDTATSRIWSAYEQVRAYDATLAWADVATIHQLRIASKRLRYSLEFFREVLGAEAGPLIERVTRLQDHLGLLNDADVAARLAREFLVASAARLSPPTIEAVGRYLGARDRDVARLRRSLPAAWRPLAAESFRRALGRAVSAL